MLTYVNLGYVLRSFWKCLRLQNILIFSAMYARYTLEFSENFILLPFYIWIFAPFYGSKPFGSRNCWSEALLINVWHFIMKKKLVALTECMDLINKNVEIIGKLLDLCKFILQHYARRLIFMKYFFFSLLIFKKKRQILLHF